VLKDLIFQQNINLKMRVKQPVFISEKIGLKKRQKMA